MRRGVALDGGREDLTSPLLGGLAQDLIVAQDQAADLVLQVVLDPSEQEGPGLLGTEQGDTVQRLALFGQNLLDFLAFLLEFLALIGDLTLERLELLVLPVDRLELLVEEVGALLEPPFVVAELAAGDLDLDVDRIAAAERVLLGLEVGLLANGIGLAVSPGEDLLGEPRADCERIRA